VEAAAVATNFTNKAAALPFPASPCHYCYSTLVTLIWIVYYWVLYFMLLHQHKAWQFDSWDVVDGAGAREQLNAVMTWSYWYGAWLYMGIVVDFLIFMRIARYMRIHKGLKAFYQVRLRWSSCIYSSGSCCSYLLLPAAGRSIHVCGIQGRRQW
jgi:hypothetical protein